MQIDEYIDNLVDSEGSEFVEKLARVLIRRGFARGEKVTARITVSKPYRPDPVGWTRHDVILEIGDNFSITDTTNLYRAEDLIFKKAQKVFSLGGWKQEKYSSCHREGIWYEHIWTVYNPTEENLQALKDCWRGAEYTS